MMKNLRAYPFSVEEHGSLAARIGVVRHATRGSLWKSLSPYLLLETNKAWLWFFSKLNGTEDGF